MVNYVFRVPGQFMGKLMQDVERPDFCLIRQACKPLRRLHEGAIRAPVQKHYVAIHLCCDGWNRRVLHGKACLVERLLTLVVKELLACRV